MLNKGPSFLILLLMGHVQSTLQWWGSLHAAEHGTKTAKHVHSSVGGVLFTSYLLMHLGNHFSRGPFADKRCSLTCFGIESEWLLSQGDPYSSLNPEPFGVTKALLASLCTYTGLEFGLTRLVGCTSLGGTGNGHLAASQGAPEALWRLCLASGTKNLKIFLKKSDC